MPRKKQYKGKRRKRYTRLNTSTQLTGTYGIMPKKFKTKLIYSELFSLDPATGATTGYVFSANGLYDPNITSTGHQPRGFDQLMAMYDHYTVIGSKIVVRFDNQDNSEPALVAIRLSDDGTYSSNITDTLEDPSVRVKTLGGNTGNPTVTLTKACNPSKFLGRPSPLDNGSLRGSASANPSEQVYYNIMVMPMDALINLNRIYLQATIEYVVIFNEPSTPPIS